MGSAECSIVAFRQKICNNGDKTLTAEWLKIDAACLLLRPGSGSGHGLKLLRETQGKFVERVR